MITYELKNPCPFCGKKLTVVSFEVFPGTDLETTFFEPECETDDCTVNDLERYYDTPEEVAKAWDRRVSPWRTDELQKGDIAIVEFSDDLIAKVRFNGDGWEVIGLPVEIRDGAFEVIRWMEVPE